MPDYSVGTELKKQTALLVKVERSLDRMANAVEMIAIELQRQTISGEPMELSELRRDP